MLRRNYCLKAFSTVTFFSPILFKENRNTFIFIFISESQTINMLAYGPSIPVTNFHDPNSDFELRRIRGLDWLESSGLDFRVSDST